METINRGEQLVSIGQMAVEFATPVALLTHYLAELAVEPALILNGVPYFTAADESAAYNRLVETGKITPVMIHFPPVPLNAPPNPEP